MARPRCDQAPSGDGSGARRDGSPESGDGAGATGGHSGYGDMMVYCAGHQTGINTEITSLALILVMVTVFGFVAITGGGILCCGISRITQLIEVTRLVQIFVRSLDICDHLFFQQTETVMNQARVTELSTIPCYNL